MVRQSANPLAVIDAIQEVEGRLGDFIANGPSTGLQGYVRDQYRKRCDQFANSPGWAQSLVNAAGGSLGRICEPWYAARGFDGPTAQPPFTGGQCPGVSYNLSWSATAAANNCTTFTDSPQLNGRMGPISYRLIHNTALSQPVGGLCPGFSTNQLLITANGVEFVGGGQARGYSLNSFNVIRGDGQPDNCGDPPPELEPGPNPPPDPGPTPGPEPTTDPENPTGPPLLPIPPYDDPIGGPTPIVGPDPFDRGAEPTDIPGNPDTSPGGGDDVAEPINVDPGPGGGGNETDFGEPPDGRVWVGCLLRFTFPSSIGAIAGSGPANPVSPRVVGNASLVFEGGRGDAFQVRSGSMVVVRPTGALRVTGVYVNSDPGITYTIRPLSLKKCPDNECSSE